MQAKRKLTALLLSLCMVLGMLPMTCLLYTSIKILKPRPIPAIRLPTLMRLSRVALNAPKKVVRCGNCQANNGGEGSEEPTDGANEMVRPEPCIHTIYPLYIPFLILRSEKVSCCLLYTSIARRT